MIHYSMKPSGASLSSDWGVQTNSLAVVGTQWLLVAQTWVDSHGLSLWRVKALDSAAV